MALTDTTAPVLGELTLRVRPATSPSVAVEFTRFLSYKYTENYLDTSDKGFAEIAEKELSATDAAALKPGNVIQVVCNGNVQSAGIIDDVESDFDRHAGAVVRIIWRDWMSIIVDAQVDPQQSFKPSMTVLDLVTACLTPYGITTYATDNIANRNVITGRVYGSPTSIKGRTLKSYILGQERPRRNEGVFAFVSRVCQRFGLWVRASTTVGTVVISKPDFDQPPRYGLQYLPSSNPNASSNNFERGHFARSREEQPSILIGYGVGGGGVFEKTKLRAGITNPVVNADNSAILNAYPNVPFQTVPAVTAAFPPLIEGNARPAFIYDNESHTIDQLNAFLLRELSLRMRKALRARYEIMGHILNGQPVAVDTIVSVNDQRPTVQWQGPLYVLGREFSKSSAGTRTTLDLILPGSLVF